MHVYVCISCRLCMILFRFVLLYQRASLSLSLSLFLSRSLSSCCRSQVNVAKIFIFLSSLSLSLSRSLLFRLSGKKSQQHRFFWFLHNRYVYALPSSSNLLLLEKKSIFAIRVSVDVCNSKRRKGRDKNIYKNTE